APESGPSRGDEEEHERIQRRQLTLVLDRQATPRLVGDEGGGGHLAPSDERRQTTEKANHDQNSADQLDHAGQSHHRGDRLNLAGEDTEELLRTMHREHESRDNAQQGVDLLRESSERSSHTSSSLKQSKKCDLSWDFPDYCP